jgi:hypothetical protein
MVEVRLDGELCPKAYVETSTHAEGLEPTIYSQVGAREIGADCRSNNGNHLLAPRIECFHSLVEIVNPCSYLVCAGVDATTATYADVVVYMYRFIRSVVCKFHRTCRNALVAIDTVLFYYIYNFRQLHGGFLVRYVPEKLYTLLILFFVDKNWVPTIEMSFLKKRCVQTLT